MVRRRGLAEIALVAAHALGRKAEAIELSDGSYFVTSVTIHNCVSANQWKAILVFINVVDGNLPSIRVMAEFTLRPVLATMQISVTVLAFCRNIAEYQISVAIAAFHFHVPPAQGKSGLRVFEFEFGPKWIPIDRRMTLQARNFELVPVRAMCRYLRASCRHLRMDWRAHRGAYQNAESNYNQNLKTRHSSFPEMNY